MYNTIKRQKIGLLLGIFSAFANSNFSMIKGASASGDIDIEGVTINIKDLNKDTVENLNQEIQTQIDDLGDDKEDEKKALKKVLSNKKIYIDGKEIDLSDNTKKLTDLGIKDKAKAKVEKEGMSWMKIGGITALVTVLVAAIGFGVWSLLDAQEQK